ncbi:hypothetical protein OXYTRIMIC_382 [Oxytricha trifallax]|uniref:Uncharacterized protein n=1 Tax=Oxytricha trifallax TaxID=1172189 RepID=A0A073HXX0_9SPIT|nr:hypothetical protein OXYTRIMIC_382 [Oxytricha trifallax]
MRGNDSLGSDKSLISQMLLQIVIKWRELEIHERSCVGFQSSENQNSQYQALGLVEEREIVNAAYSWDVLKGYRTKVALFKTQITEDQEDLQQKKQIVGSQEQRMCWVEEIIQNIILQILNHSNSFAIKLLDENPFVPYTFASHLKRIICNKNSTQLQKGYNEVVNQTCQRDQDQRSSRDTR